MGGPVVYVLLFCSTLPSLGSSQEVDHNRHSRLDTNPDMELRPVRPLRRTTTQRPYTVNDNVLLPLPPYKPDDRSAQFDNEYDYSYSTSYEYDNYYHSGTHGPHKGSGNFHEHDHDSSAISTGSVADYPEYEDHLDGHKDHFKNTSAALVSALYSVVLSLILMRIVAQI